MKAINLVGELFQFLFKLIDLNKNPLLAELKDCLKFILALDRL